MKKCNGKKTAKPSYKNTLRLLVFSLVILVFFLSLSSCSRFGGTEEILAKQELIGNSLGDTKNQDYVCEYLDRWDFPRFDIKKMKNVENKFLDSCYYTPVSALTHARALAKFFVENYYEKTDLTNPDEVTDALIKSYAETSSDKYAKYYTANEYAEYLKKMSGDYSDVGLTVQIVNGKLTVSRVHEQLGAYDAGIIPGDVILSVDGKSVDGISVSELYEKLYGKEGTFVDITVKRQRTSEIIPDGWSDDVDDVIIENLSFKVCRKPSVSYYLHTDPNDLNNDGIGFIKIAAFKENTAELFKQAINYMLENEAKGIVFDVRDNRGGYVEAAVKMLEYIAPLNKTVVTYRNKSGAKTVIRVIDVHAITTPCAVLCNENTASAGELFAAALDDYFNINVLDSYVVGEESYGKGVMQETVKLSDGSAISLSTASFSSPLDKKIDEVGVKPSIAVSNSEIDARNGYDRQKDAAVNKIADRIAVYYSQIPKAEFLKNLTEKINKTTNKHDYIAQYFREWELPICDMNKIRVVQDVYMQRVEPPHDIFAHAKKAILVFVDQYYENVKLSDRAKFTNALIASWVISLGDEWASYRTAEDFIVMEDDGEDSIGLGITIDKREHVIVNIFTDSDAHIQGIKEGDILYKVNGIEFTFDNPNTIENEDNYNEIAKMFKGDINTALEITVLREGEEITKLVTRKVIDTRTVTFSFDYRKLKGTTLVAGTSADYDFKFGFVKISSFKSNTPEQFKDAIDKLEAAGVDGFVFDLRGNVGGTLDAVQDTISYLLPPGLDIASFDYVNGTNRAPIKSYGVHSIGKIPCAVLCNRYTASGAELFAAVLRDYTKLGIMDAIIVGETTLGKGVMQETQRLYDGSTITLTVAKYYPPLGEESGYNGTGVTPDVVETKASSQENRAALEVVKKIIYNESQEKTE